MSTVPFVNLDAIKYLLPKLIRRCQLRANRKQQQTPKVSRICTSHWQNLDSRPPRSGSALKPHSSRELILVTHPSGAPGDSPLSCRSEFASPASGRRGFRSPRAMQATAAYLSWRLCTGVKAGPDPYASAGTAMLGFGFPGSLDDGSDDHSSVPPRCAF